MLTQWRYKVSKDFGKWDGSIVGGRKLNKIVHSKPYPDGFFLYRETKRKYDYVDYTGVHKGVCVTLSDMTPLLEFLGYIKYIDKEECNGRVFRK